MGVFSCGSSSSSSSSSSKGSKESKESKESKSFSSSSSSEEDGTTIPPRESSDGFIACGYCIKKKSGEGFPWSECGLICNEDDQVDCDCDMNPETTTIPPRMNFF